MVKKINTFVLFGDKLKLNLKTKIFFVGVNENLTTFLFTLNRGDKKTEGEKKVFFFKEYTKVECY